MNTKTTEKNQSIAEQLIADAAKSAYQAYLATAAERASVTEADSVATNVDVGDSVIVALGAAPKVKEHREALVKLPGFREQSVTCLDIYALACSCADGLLEAAAEAPANLSESVAKGTVIRDRLAVTAQALANWGLFPAERIDDMRNGVSHQGVGENLIALGSWFYANRESIKNRCPATQADIEEALAMGKLILELVAQRGAQPVTDAANERRRAFVLLNRAYDEVRRGLLWVRWKEGDAEEIAPSFHSHARTAKKGKPEGIAVPVMPAKEGAVAKPIVTPVVAKPLPPIEGTTDKPVPVSNPFTT